MQSTLSLLALLVLAGCGAFHARPSPRTRSPNDPTSCSSSPTTSGGTPSPHWAIPKSIRRNTDGLVKRGFHFNNAYCMGSMVGAVCLPSRTMLITGRSLWHIPENPRAKKAPPDVPTLPALIERRRLRHVPLRQGRQLLHVRQRVSSRRISPQKAARQLPPPSTPTKC